MNSSMKFFVRGAVRNLAGFPRHMTSSPSLEASVNHGRCFLSDTTTSSDFKPVRKETLQVLRGHGIINENFLQKIGPALSSGNPKAWNDLLITMRKLGFGPISVVNMALKYPKLLNTPSERLQKRWEFWLECFHQADVVRELFMVCPLFMSLSKDEVHLKFEQLRAVIGSRKFVAILVKKCPQIMFQNLSDLENVCDYISMKMVVRNAADYYKSVALGCTLEEIKTRHVFLERCGKYKTPNLKQSDKIPTSNPSLSEIYDSTEEEFAKIAGVTQEEFFVFRTMFEKEIMDGAEDTDAGSGSDYSDED